MPNDNVLTPDQIGKAWRESGAVSTMPPDWALNFARAIEREVLAAHPGQPEPRAEVTHRFIAEYGHRLAELLHIDAFDIADRDAQIKLLINCRAGGAS